MLISSLIKSDLKLRAETRQLRNLELKNTAFVSAETSRSKLVMLSKDHLNPKKSSGSVFQFLPRFIVEILDKDLQKVDVSSVQQIIEALGLISTKELIKIGEGNYLTLLISLGFTLKISSVTKLIEKCASIDNQTISLILNEVRANPESPFITGLTLKKVFIELIQYYALKEDAQIHISTVFKVLAKSHIQILGAALRDIRNLVLQSKIQVPNFEALQKLVQQEKLHSVILSHKELS